MIYPLLFPLDDEDAQMDLFPSYRFEVAPGVVLVRLGPGHYRIERGGVLTPDLYRDRASAFAAAVRS